MGIIGSIGGRYTKIEKKNINIVSAGGINILYNLETCPSNTTRRLSSFQVKHGSSGGYHAQGLRFTILDTNGFIYTLTKFPIANFTGGVWRAYGFVPQKISDILVPSEDIDSQTAIAADELASHGRFDTQTGEFIMQEGDVLRLEISNTTSGIGGNRNIDITYHVNEEKRG
jgi:hypothetical protein